MLSLKVYQVSVDYQEKLGKRGYYAKVSICESWRGPVGGKEGAGNHPPPGSFQNVTY